MVSEHPYICESQFGDIRRSATCYSALVEEENVLTANCSSVEEMSQRAVFTYINVIGSPITIDVWESQGFKAGMRNSCCHLAAFNELPSIEPARIRAIIPPYFNGTVVQVDYQVVLHLHFED